MDITEIWKPQEGPQLMAMMCPVRMILFGGARGGGKSLPLSAKVLTPKGWSTMGDMRIGSAITNPANGGVQRVVGVYPQGEMDIYEVLFDDGAKAWCTLDHLWAYKCANRTRPGSKKSEQREWLKLEHDVEYSTDRFDGFKVGTTKDLVVEVGTKTSPRIPLTAPVLYSVNGRSGKNGVDPYLLGLLFGDGTFSNGQRGHMVTTGDQEIADILAEHGFEPSGDIVCANGVYRSWYLPKASPLSAKLSSWASNHGLIGAAGKRKVVPAYILTADVEFRVGFLQGLLDSDGYVDDRGHIEFSNISESIVFAVRDLVRSLGGKATVSDLIVGKYKDSAGETVECQEYRRVYIWLPYPSMAFRLKRKAQRCVKSWNGGHENMRKVVSIEFSHREEAQCIKVSSVHGLFVTDDYVVTHNTDCAIGKQVYGAMRYGADWNGLFIRKNYKYFADIRRRLNQLIRAGLPAELVGPAQGTNYLRFQNGANVTLTVIESIEKAEFFQGQSMTCVVIEEACQFSYIDPMIEMLKGCLRSAAGVPTSMFLTANPGGSGHCVRRGEVLTASGWVPIQDVSVGDMVYSVDHTDALVLRRVTGTYAGLYDGDMVTVKARGLTVDCTPNHRVAKVGFTGDKPFDLVEFQNLPGQAYLKRTVGSWEGEELLEFTPESYPTRKLVLNQPRSLSGDLYLELLGWVIAEGYAPQSSESKYFGIAQSNPSKRLLLEGMLKRCGFSYRVSSNAYEVQSPWWWAHFKEQWYCRDKFIPEFAKNVSRRQLWILFNAMMIGDGHWVREGKSGEYYTISRQLADDVCEILVKMGMNVHLSQRQRENREGLSYTVCFKPAPKMGGQEILTGNHLYAVATKTKRKTNIVREHYRGFVYCIEVEETGNFIIRQDGSVWVSGNSAIKSRFMPRGSKPGQIVDDGLGTQMVFIPSNVEDNKVLCDNDPDYVNLLRSIKDPVLRKAWLEGDWDVVLGGFFSDVWNPFKHVVPNFKPPMHWPRIVGMDWGSSTPFSIGWYCISDGETSVSLGGKSRVFPKGAMIRFYEWYGCPRNSVTGRIEANVGLRLTSEDVADRVLELEARMPWLMGTTISTDRIADPSIFAEKDGPSIAEKMSLRGLVWRKGENKRISGWDSLRNLLYGRVLKRTFRDMPDGSREVEHEEREPMLYFTEGCTHMIRTLPEMERDLHNIEDLDDSLEDHACDELRYVVTSRPSTGVLLRDVMPRTQMTDGERDFAEAMQGGSVSGMENLSLPRSADTGFGVSSVRNLSLHIAR